MICLATLLSCKLIRILIFLNVRVIEQKGISYLNADLPTHFLLVINFVDTITFCTTNNLIRYINIVKCPL